MKGCVDLSLTRGSWESAKEESDAIAHLGMCWRVDGKHKHEIVERDKEACFPLWKGTVDHPHPLPLIA